MSKCVSCVKESALSSLRVVENIPLLGHAVGALYQCCMKNKDRRQRAMLKATAGFFCVLCNCPVETADEMFRKRPIQLRPKIMNQPKTDWMAAYPDKSILELSIPASHQSATYKISKNLRKLPLLEGWSRCQDMSVDEQLDAGVRFLDLRVMDHGDDVWLHHNVIVCVTLSEVLASVARFIEAHQTEVVFLNLSSDGKEVNWEKCDNIIQEHLKDKLIPESMKDKPIGKQGMRIIVWL